MHNVFITIHMKQEHRQTMDSFMRAAAAAACCDVQGCRVLDLLLVTYVTLIKTPWPED